MTSDATGSGAPLCAVDHLKVTALTEQGRKVVVDDVSFSFGRGAYFALVGESGSGKSVTCHALMRLLPFAAEVEGSIRVDGTDVWSLSPGALRAYRRHSVGMIFQDPLAALNPVRTIGSQMIETLRLHHPEAGGDDLRERAIDALSRVHVPQPSARLSAYPHQLSGGLNQRVTIALALMGDPSLLIADEPTTALDMSVQAEILDLLDELRATSGISVLMVTHDLGIVADRATSIAVMQSGRIVEQGPTDRILAAPAHDYTVALFEAASLGKLREPAARPARAPKLCLAFEGVDKVFRPSGRHGEPVVAADRISFSVAEGEIVALVGESGSGKTTAAKMAMGLVKPDAGRITVGSVTDKARHAVGPQMVFQHPKDSLDPLMKVGAQLHEVLMVHGWKDRAARETRIREIIADVGLDAGVLERRPTFLSGGEAQRVVIARAIMLGPPLLIADEPLSAVDVCLQKQILDCFRGLREKRGIAILLITHDLRIVLDIADRVVVMRSGRIVEDVPLALFSDGARDPYTQKLIDAIPGRDFEAAPDPDRRPPVDWSPSPSRIIYG
ncbi:ABC transporter ATP-binding protein [Prosthecomicrobium sp. N25]|uniref:ABC transporter ATP-binding protein n=1 Tax=Prosthecomicrobium sp. N25 TaxID=3129254 RepID=UPI003076ABC6